MPVHQPCNVRTLFAAQDVFFYSVMNGSVFVGMVSRRKEILHDGISVFFVLFDSLEKIDLCEMLDVERHGKKLVTQKHVNDG